MGEELDLASQRDTDGRRREITRTRYLMGSPFRVLVTDAHNDQA